MEELENKIETIEQNLMTERSKEKIKISEKDIVRFIKNALLKEPKQAIWLLVNKIILYPEKVEIYYNYTEKKIPMMKIIGIFLSIKAIFAMKILP